MSRELEWKEELNTERLRRVYNFLNSLLYDMDDGKVQGIQLPMSIAFVKMAEKGDIDETTAKEHQELFLGWGENVSYSINSMVRYGREETKLYKCLQDHTSQADWTPDVSPSLWKEIGISEDGIEEWSQPISAGDAYMIGNIVRHNGVKYKSIVDNNVWEPGVYGWEVVE